MNSQSVQLLSEQLYKLINTHRVPVVTQQATSVTVKTVNGLVKIPLVAQKVSGAGVKSL